VGGVGGADEDQNRVRECEGERARMRMSMGCVVHYVARGRIRLEGDLTMSQPVFVVMMRTGAVLDTELGHSKRVKKPANDGMMVYEN
jgi:hypothetical protein